MKPIRFFCLLIMLMFIAVGCKKKESEPSKQAEDRETGTSVKNQDTIAHGRTDFALGTVEIPTGMTVAIINSNNEHITIRTTERTPQLPVGEYLIDHWTMEREDDFENIWKLKGTDFGYKGIFEVVEGQITKLPIGEPIVSSLVASKQNSIYCFNHHLRGQLSEAIQLTKNGKRPEAPKLRIRNVDDSYQEALTFEYG